MNRKTGALLFFGSALLVASFVLGWRAFATEFESPVPAIVFPIVAILSFILAIILLARATRAMRNVQSTMLLNNAGTVALVIGAAASLYACAAFFIDNELPPNTEFSRLPSLFMLFVAMLVMFLGTAMRDFRLRK